MAATKSRILIVDDHPLVRRGLTHLINREADLVVCGEAGSGRQAVEVLGVTRPDLVILDLSLEDIDGVDLIRTLKLQQPRVLILVVSVHDESVYAERALRAGAHGYVMKQELDEKIMLGIRGVLRDGLYLSETMARVFLSTFFRGRDSAGAASPARLSDRELEVFELVGQGLKPRQIADRLDLSVKTVESHCARIKEKLKLHTAGQLLQRATQWRHAETE